MITSSVTQGEHILLYHTLLSVKDTGEQTVYHALSSPTFSLDFFGKEEDLLVFMDLVQKLKEQLLAD